MMEDIQVMQERVNTEMLEETRNNLREECKILKASLVALRRYFTLFYILHVFTVVLK